MYLQLGINKETLPISGKQTRGNLALSTEILIDMHIIYENLKIETMLNSLSQLPLKSGLVCAAIAGVSIIQPVFHSMFYSVFVGLNSFSLCKAAIIHQ